MRSHILCVLAVAAICVVAVASAQAATISVGALDSATLGDWRTAAPDGDLKYGTDGYVMFYYAQALQQSYLVTRSPNYNPATQDLAALPGYVSSYAVPTYTGADGGTYGADMYMTPQHPTLLTKPATNHVYRDEGNPEVQTFTMQANQHFKLGLYLGHEFGAMYPTWTAFQTYTVAGSLGGSATSTNINLPAGQWQIFDVTAAAGEIITVSAQNLVSTGGGIGGISIMAFDPIPEPGTLVLLATGLVGLLCYAWRKRK